MASIKFENDIYTLRNVKGNELKVAAKGAKIVSLRLRNKNFENKFIVNSDSKTYINGSADYDEKTWTAEQITEGVKFSLKDNNKEIFITYSISNDNEVSITYEGSGIEDITTAVPFNGEVLIDPKFKVYTENYDGENTGSWTIIDKPAIVEMELGMFGFDIGCPIDWLASGLKNAADIISETADMTVNMYATQNNIQIDSINGGFAIKTSGTKHDNGVIKAQTVYVFKNKS